MTTYMRFHYDKPDGIEVESPQHELMAAHYRDIIVNAMKEFDDSFDQEIYQALAWVGLMGKGHPPDPVTGLLPIANTVVWEFHKTIEDRLEVLNTIGEFKASNTNCQ